MRSVVALVSVLLFAPTGPQSPIEPVNAVIGDDSWVARKGHAPTEQDDGHARITTHLVYVEGLLRSEEPPGLSVSQREKRHASLDVLATYWQRGVYPKNDVYRTRRPRFIDPAGRRCAVAELIATSVGEQTAEALAADHEWDYLLRMNDPRVAQWAHRHGFTLTELAMIQPGYGWDDERRDPSQPRARPAWHQLASSMSTLKATVAACAATHAINNHGTVQVSVTWRVDEPVPDARVGARPRARELERCVLEAAQELATSRFAATKYHAEPEVRAVLSFRY